MFEARSQSMPGRFSALLSLTLCGLEIITCTKDEKIEFVHEKFLPLVSVIGALLNNPVAFLFPSVNFVYFL